MTFDYHEAVFCWIAFLLVVGIVTLIGALTDNQDKPEFNDMQDIKIAVIDNSGLINSEIVNS